jgi:hypothetical protein
VAAWIEPDARAFAGFRWALIRIRAAVGAFMAASAAMVTALLVAWNCAFQRSEGTMAEMIGRADER